MNEQLALLGGDAPRLTDYQAQSLERVRCEPEGLLADELGAIIHERRLTDGKVGHTAGSRCPYCHRDGLQMLKALRAKGLVVRRRKTGRWQALDGQTQPPPVGLQEHDVDWGGF